MHSILQLFIRHGGLLTLVVLEMVCLYLISKYNTPQGAIASASWLKYSGMVMNWKASLYDYASLRSENNRLRDENARLQKALANTHLMEIPVVDSLGLRVPADTALRKIIRPKYSFLAARVISNSIGGRNNWMIINRGEKDGVRVNSGVISADGLAGIVRYVTDEFAMVMSVLHPQTKISAAIKNYNYFGSLSWEGKDPTTMTLSDIPYHLPVRTGDTVEVSKYSLLFPAGHPVGTVDTSYRKTGSNFLFIRVNLSQPPASLNDVYVVINEYSGQIDQLQQAVKENE